MSLPALVVDTPLPPPAHRRPEVTKTMLKAGRAAFMRHRAHLSDLYTFFESDRDDFLRSLYRSMRKAEES